VNVARDVDAATGDFVAGKVGELRRVVEGASLARAAGKVVRPAWVVSTFDGADNTATAPAEVSFGVQHLSLVPMLETETIFTVGEDNDVAYYSDSTTAFPLRIVLVDVEETPGDVAAALKLGDTTVRTSTGKAWERRTGAENLTMEQVMLVALYTRLPSNETVVLLLEPATKHGVHPKLADALAATAKSPLPRCALASAACRPRLIPTPTPTPDTEETTLAPPVAPLLARHKNDLGMPVALFTVLLGAAALLLLKVSARQTVAGRLERTADAALATEAVPQVALIGVPPPTADLAPPRSGLVRRATEH